MTKREWKNIKSWAKFVLAVCAVVTFAVFFVFYAWSPVRAPISVVVRPGMSVNAMTNYLVKNRVIYSGDLFKFLVRMNGGKIMAGEYDIPRGIGVWGVADKITHGRVAMTSVTIPEGYTIKQIKSLLMNTTSLTGDVDCDSDAPVCHLNDGDIFPDTYRIARGGARLTVLEVARKKMIDVKSGFAKYDIPKPLKNWDEVMVLASIVQKETPLKREMPIVAGVYLNRLNINMRLQACPTVVYALTDGLGDMNGEPLLSGHLKVDSVYNTYTHNGLPPKPIANVGRDAIRAVLKPAKSNYLFFVADGRGGHHFSHDFEEHKKYHNDWRLIKKDMNK